MITNVIKTDMENAYFYNKQTKEKQDYYEKDDNLVLIAKINDGSVLTIENASINVINEQLVFKYDQNTRYIIDDGYQNVLIRCGYLIMNSYDQEKIDDKVKGYEIRNQFFNNIKLALPKVISDMGIDTPIDYKSQSIEFYFEKNGFLYRVSFDTISNIVAKNQQRKINDMIYYPFEKNMDKYGTIYLTIFCKKILYHDNGSNNDKYQVGEDFLKNLIVEINNFADADTSYHFYRFIIKRRIIYSRGM